jgi:hypothetical protein
MDHVPDPILLRKSGSAGNRTRDLWICSQELWPLDHKNNNWLGDQLLASQEGLCSIEFVTYIFLFFEEVQNFKFISLLFMSFVLD